MKFMLNEKTGAVVPWNPVLAARRTDKALKPISEAEALRRLGAEKPKPKAPEPADAHGPEPDGDVEPVDPTDPNAVAFAAFKAKLDTFDDKEAIDKFAEAEYSVKLDRRQSLDKMKAALTSAVAETFGVEA